MKTEINTKIKVFPQLYVGLKAQFHYDHATKQRTQLTNLGFATPYEDNAAFRKRKATVDDWARPGSDYDYVSRTSTPRKKIEPITVDNVPVSGFKITDEIRRVYWGGGNVVWRVEDPRGFELEMSSQNLMAIIQTVGLQAGGEIPGKCVWARDGANNVLLHESTEEFKTAFQVGKTASPLGTKLRPELIGCKASFKGGYVGTYLGAGSCFTWNGYDERTTFRHEYQHFFLDDDNKSLTTYRDPKPLLIEKSRELTDDEALKLINRLREKITTAGASRYGTRYTKVNRAKKPASLELVLRPVTVEAASKMVTVKSNYFESYIYNSANALLVGRRGTQLFSLYTSDRDAYGHRRGTERRLALTEMGIEGDSTVQRQDRLVITLPDVPNDRQDTGRTKQWETAATLQVLQTFDSLAVVDAAVTY
jgi:hypothetical protein